MSTTATDFSNIAFFGDSLTDNGNLFARFGIPPAPYVAGRFSNGPTYAEIAPGLMGVAAENYAFGGARAIDRDTGTVITPTTPQIDLADQVRLFLAAHPGGAAPGTAAALYIGNNDFLSPQVDLTDPALAAQYIGNIATSIATAAGTLAAAGVGKIILFTLPHITFTPLASTLPAAQVVGANTLIDYTNAAIGAVAQQLGALHINVEIVDTNKFTDEIGADASTFGFHAPLNIPVFDGANFTGVTSAYAADEIAFFDGVHPTAAAHGVTASFVAASLAADRVTFSTAGNNFETGVAGGDLIFSGAGNDRVMSLAGDDTVFAGTGRDFVGLGGGDDIGAGGSGNDVVFGGDGNDIVAGNDGNDLLDGDDGRDLLILGRGNDIAFGGRGDDLFIVENESGLRDHDAVFGGQGFDRLLIEVGANDAAAVRAEIAALGDHHSGYLRSIGLAFSSIEQIDVVVTGIASPSATVADAARALAPSLSGQITSADLWGFI